MNSLAGLENDKHLVGHVTDELKLFTARSIEYLLSQRFKGFDKVTLTQYDERNAQHYQINCAVLLRMQHVYSSVFEFISVI